MLNDRTSRTWPYVRAIAKALTIPGTNIGLGVLTDIQDQLSTEQFERELMDALTAIHKQANEIANILRQYESVDVPAERLSEAALQIAESFYLQGVADRYLYADFKGIVQLEKLVPLQLDDVFVNLRVRVESNTPGQGRLFPELSEDLEHADSDKLATTESRLAERDVQWAEDVEGVGNLVTVDHILRCKGGLVMLGGPGSGKTTLVKRLARTLALGRDVVKKRYPELPWCFPVVIPVALYDVKGQDLDLFAFICKELVERGGETLKLVFERYWGLGQCLVLLDGMDEVADTGHRIACARGIGDLVRECQDNRVLITSRLVGYSICRISVPVSHVILQPLERGDMETFVRQWHIAYETAVHPDCPDIASAKNAANELIHEIESNERVESLAKNPLMLTIIALIKNQNITLPERRVELYEIALTTLIKSWNKARSLSNRPVGQELSAEETKKIWASIAYWMHSERSTGTCHREHLQRRLVEVLTEIGKDEIEAEKIAESYIAAAAERAGLLEERGTNVFAFMHQTFQEYLAARYLWLAKPYAKAPSRVLEVAHNPRWYEVVRLTAGFVGVIQENDEAVTELVSRIADDNRDPLEPYLCPMLRLAASCIADDVRVSTSEASKVIATICERLEVIHAAPALVSLCGSLASMRRVIPDRSAVLALLKLSKHQFWRCRMEAFRMLCRAAPRYSDILDHMQEMFSREMDPDARAHVAIALWRNGVRKDVEVVRALARGLARPPASIDWEPDTEFRIAVRDLFNDSDEEVQIAAASVLWRWGHQEGGNHLLGYMLNHRLRWRALDGLAETPPNEGLIERVCNLMERTESYIDAWHLEFLLFQWLAHPLVQSSVRNLLDSPIPHVRLRAAMVLRTLNCDAKVTRVAMDVLADSHEACGEEAARELRTWEVQPEVMGQLEKLLASSSTTLILRAAEVLSRWNNSQCLRECLRQLLDNSDISVQLRAAELLLRCKDYAPIKLFDRLCEHQDARIRLAAARMLKETHSGRAAVVLRRLVQSADEDMRLSAATMLGELGDYEAAGPALIRMLEGPDESIRGIAEDTLSRWRLGIINGKRENLPFVAPKTVGQLLGGQLTAAHSFAREASIRILSAWGEQPGLAIFVFSLLKQSDAVARESAIELISRWPGSGEVAKLVLQSLNCDNFGEVAGFFDAAIAGNSGWPNEKLAESLAEVVGKRSQSNTFIESLQRIALTWLWRALDNSTDRRRN